VDFSDVVTYYAKLLKDKKIRLIKLQDYSMQQRYIVKVEGVAYSEATRPLIPMQSGHPFQGKANRKKRKRKGQAAVQPVLL